MRCKLRLLHAVSVGSRTLRSKYYKCYKYKLLYIIIIYIFIIYNYMLFAFEIKAYKLICIGNIRGEQGKWRQNRRNKKAYIRNSANAECELSGDSSEKHRSSLRS
jgi:hypothetical protein